MRYIYTGSRNYSTVDSKTPIMNIRNVWKFHQYVICIFCMYLYTSTYFKLINIRRLLIITQHDTNFHRTTNFYMRVEFSVSVWTSCRHAFFLCSPLRDRCYASFINTFNVTFRHDIGLFYVVNMPVADQTNERSRVK